MDDTLLSALKTKAEVMDVSKLLPAKAQWGNFVSIFTASPMVKYIGNSLFVSIAVVAIQVERFMMHLKLPLTKWK